MAWKNLTEDLAELFHNEAQLEEQLRLRATDATTRRYMLGLGQAVRATQYKVRPKVAFITEAERLERNEKERQWRSRCPETVHAISKRYEAKPETKAKRAAAKKARLAKMTREDRDKRNAQDRARRLDRKRAHNLHEVDGAGQVA